MDDNIIPVLAIVSLFIGLPWLVFHYITKWKTAATLTSGDVVNLSGTGNTLNAFFQTNGLNVVAGETIKGVQTWNFSNLGVVPLPPSM